MRTGLRVLSVLVVLFLLAGISTTTFASIHTSAVPKARVISRVDNSKRTTLYGHVPAATRRAKDLGRIDPNTPAEHLMMVLKSDENQKRELRRIIDEQQDKNTANYHQWVTPEEFGAHFGVHGADIKNIKAWLNSQGLTVESVNKSKRAIRFSGTVGQIEQAFQIEMHQFRTPNGETHVSNDRDITVPTALSPVIAGVPTLNDFFRKSHRVEVGRMSRMKPGPAPKFSNATNCAQTGAGTNDGNLCYVGPADFATIYNTAPLLASGINGSGVTIGIVGRSDILMSDVQTYRQLFNLPVNDPVFIHAGQDIGIEAGDDVESDLDVEISGGIAPNATVKFVIGTPTFLVDGITNSMEYIVENNAADIMSTSYGDCESNEGADGNAFNSELFEQAAAQGISVFVADGDNGAAECDDSSDSYEVLGYAASAEGSTPYNISVGGTEFDEGTNTGYWSNTNNPLNLSSALSYIPEVPWNEAKSSSYDPIDEDLSGLWAGSGGISAYYIQPAWQRGSGVPTTDPVLTQGGDWIVVNITNPGSGYTTAPTLTFSGETCASNPPTGTHADTGILGTGAQAGQVVGINYNDGTQGGTLYTGQGFGCTVAGTVAFTAAPSGGNTATGTPVLAQMQNMLPLNTGFPHRYTPDLALNAASGHDATFFCTEGVCEISSTGALEGAGLVGGTSVAAPSMAGVQALINQANGGRQGMPGYIYYTLANNQYQNNPGACNSSTPPASGANCAFQDITTGDNLICGTSSCTTTPAKMGFTAGTGYDMATGLGSVNAANLASQWSTVTFYSSNSTLNLSQTTFAHGTPITLSGTVAAGSGSGTPTGDVAFIVSQGAIGDTVNQYGNAELTGNVAFATLSGGSYSATLNNLPGGTYYVTARYGGDDTFGSSYSAATQVTVAQESSNFTLTTYSPNATTTCELTTPASYSYGSNILINASVAGVSGAGAATGTVTISDNGTPIATAQTLDPNGNAFLLSGPISSSSCLYQYDFANTSTFTVGTHNLTATYSGDASLGTVSATPVSVVVTQATPTLTLAAGATQITSGASDQLTATFGVSALTGGSIGSLAPTGTVTFKDTTTGATLGTANVVSTSITTINAQSTAFTAVAGPLATTGITQSGANSITATYNGDTNWAAVTSAAVTVTVGTFTTATTTTVTNAGTGTAGNPTTLGGRPTFTATVSGGAGPTSGTVTFYDTTITNNYNNLPAGTYVLGTGTVGSSHTATLRIGSSTEFGGGTHSITASYGGVASTFGPSTSATPYVERVTQGTVTNVLTAKTVGKSGQSYYFTSVITPSSTSTAFQPAANVQFFDGANSLGTAPLYSISSGNGGYGIYEANLSVNTLSAGTHTITATYLGDVNYPAISSGAQTVFVGGTPTITWPTPAAITYGTALSAAQLNATANIAGSFAYLPTAGTVLNAGSQSLSVTFTPADYTDFGPQLSNVTLQVTPATPTIVWATPAAIVYGTPLSATQLDASATPVSAGTYVYTPPAGTVLGAGSQTLSVTFTPSNTNYAASSGTVTLPVTPAGLTVVANPANGNYGLPLPAFSYGIVGFVDGDTQQTATTGAPSESTLATPASPPGFYAIAITQGTLAAANYTFTSFVGSTLTMQQGQSSVVVTSLNSSIYSNQSTTLTATVSVVGVGAAPTGNVTFMLGATVLGTGTLSAIDATDSTSTLTLNGSQLAAGVNSITAVYAGDTNYVGSTSTAITVTLLSQLATFGPVAVGTAAPVQTLTYNFTSAATLSAVNILTGGASGLDYTDGGSSTCTAGTAYTAGQSCVVTVAFTPSAAGMRAGAVTLYAGSNLPLMTWYVSGVGQSAAVTIDPGTQTTLATLTGDKPYGAALDGTGNVYVVDNVNNQVLELAAGTWTQSTVVTGLSGPTSAAVDGAGNLYVSDTKNNRVVMIPNENGTLNAGNMSTVSIAGLGAARGIAVDGGGNLYVADNTNGNVLEVPAGGGAVITAVSGLTKPSGVAVDANGNIYVAANGAVTEYPYGGGTPIPMGSGYKNPRGLAVDAAGTLYVADSGNGQIVEVPAGGATQSVFAIAGIDKPQSVALDASDNLYVTNDSNEVFQVNRTQAAGLSFSATNVGSTSAPQTVTVSDAGNQQLNVSNVAATANFTVVPSGGTDCTSSTQLASGAQCAVAVEFAPAQSGALTGTLTLIDNALNNPASTQTVQLTGGGAQVAQTITFPTIPAQTYGVGPLTLNATASSGLTVSYTVTAGPAGAVGNMLTITGAGSVTVQASQAGNSEYAAATPVSQTFTVNPAATTVVWSNPAAITYGTALSATQLNASATPVSAGTYVYTPPAGTVLNAGSQTLSVTFTPSNTNYAASTGSVTLQVNPASQTIVFTQNAPTVAPYNSSFIVAATGGGSGNQVTFSGSGACTYQGATFTMTNSTGTCTVTANQAGNANYLAASPVSQTTTASKAAQTVIFTGAPTSAPYQSTFTVSASSNSGITPTIKASGACSIGSNTVTMTSGTGTCVVTAKWAANSYYLATSATQTTSAQKLASVISWSAPASITYGTALSATQLDATASFASTPLAGTFTYLPAAGAVPKAGIDTLKVTFTPTLTSDYTTATASVQIAVGQATPVITWATPAAITYGTPLSATQLDATANVAGKFAYSPALGKVLAAGSQTLNVTFTPTDRTDHTTAQTSVTLVVSPVATTTAITSNTPNPSTPGKPVAVHFTVTSATNDTAPTGTVTVTASTTETCTAKLANGSGACSLTFTSAGPRTLTATYAGDSNNNASVSAGVTQTVK